MDEILRIHCIEPITMRCDDYQEFIMERTELIINKIESATGKTVIRIKEIDGEYDAMINDSLG